MLPPGHLAAGFLSAVVVLSQATKPAPAPVEAKRLLWLGALFGFAPDLDVFWLFLSHKTLLPSSNGDYNHRLYLSHAPLVWLMVGLIVFILARTVFQRRVVIVALAAAGSHFLFDSIEYGLKWLWPFSQKFHAVFMAGNPVVPPALMSANLTWAWSAFLVEYSQCLTARVELAVIALAVAVLAARCKNVSR